MKKFRKLLKEKRWRLTACGIGCLVAASMIFAFGSGVGVRAESIVLDDVTITEDGGVYKISTVAELTALGNAAKEQTSGKTFRMVNDITVPSVMTPATGTFAGTFDGAGHVITYENIEITVADNEVNDEAKVHGLLFGTSEGSVQNLIIDIKDTDASYIRRTKNSVTESIQNPEYENKQDALFEIGGTVSGLDANTASADAVHQALTSSDTTISGPDENGVFTQTLQEQGTQTITYAAQKAGTDYFGIVCGNNKGTIQQIFVTGNDVSISREELQVQEYSEIVQSGYRNEIYKYKREEVSNTGNEEGKTLSLTANAYVKEKTYVESVVNDELHMTVSAPTEAISGSKLIYTVTVKNNGAQSYQNFKLSVDKSGTWKYDSKEESAEANKAVNIGTIGAGVSRKVEFELDTTSIVGNAVLSFTVNGNSDLAGTKNASATLSGVHTTVVAASASNKTNSTTGVSLEVSAPMAVLKGKTVEYSILVENTSDTPYAKVVLESSVSGTWKLGTDESIGKESFAIEIPKGESRIITFSYKPENEEKVFFTTSEISESNGTAVPVVSVTCDEVQLIDTNALLSYDQSIPGLKVEVAAPVAVKQSDTDVELTYVIKVTNLSNRAYSNVQITTSKDGSWDGGNSGKTYTIGNISANGNSSVNFSINASNDFDFDINVAGECNGGSATKSSVSVSIPEIATDFFDANKNENTVIFDNGLEATLSIKEQGVFSSEKWNYTLTLENTNVQPTGAVISKDIIIETDLPDWNLQDDDKTIPAGDKVVLTKEVAPSILNNEFSVTTKEEISLNATLQTSAYKYSNITDSDNYMSDFYAVGESVKSGEPITSGNYLYAGGISGKSSGFIKEIKQEIALSGTTNPGEFELGGIAGEAETVTENWSDIYMTGASKYYGVGSGQPDDSTTAKPTSALSTNWSSVSKYEKDSEGNINISENVDLKWLVKDAEFSYTTLSEKQITATLDESIRPTNAEVLTYVIAYNARRSLDDTSEDIVYVSEQNSLDIGDSGYYRLLNAYATDGYYHYKTPVTELDKAEYVYPHDLNAPYTFDANVTRTLNPLEDNVVITFKKDDTVAQSLGGSIYYEINNSTIIPTIEADYVELKNGVANIPYEITPSMYRFTPVIDGHIYPTQTTGEFRDVTPLPAPKVTCFAYYNADGNKNAYTEFVSNRTYEAGTDMSVIPDDESTNDYTFRYKFAEGLLDSEKWEENRYIGNDKLMNDASDYTDGAVIPENMAGKDNIYLYVEITKKNNSTIYYFGPFSVSSKVQLTDYLNGVPVGEADSEHRVVDTDVVTLAVEPENVSYAEIQYIVSNVPIEPAGNTEWNNYDTLGIQLFQNKGGYVYARIKYNNEGTKFSAPQLFDYIFGSACASPIITPNTGLATSGEGSAATIESTTFIGLSSRTSGADVFYVKSNIEDSEQPMSIDMERVSPNPGNISDRDIQDGFKYFKVGNRWYRTSNTNTERYAEGLSLNHSKADDQYMYITAVAVAESYEISDELTFIYKVKAAQQVKNPEAAFETRFSPGGESIDIATVSKDGNVSFYSVTPGATLYYAIGTEGEEWKEIPQDGVTVEGDYGSNFVVRVQAKKYNSAQQEIMLPSEIVTFVYKISDQELANAPTSTPGTSADVPTTVIPGNKILLSTTTKGAIIFYTTDGTTPKVEMVEVTNEDGTTTKEYQSAKGSTTVEYDSAKGIEMPEDGKDYFTITAIAVKEGLGNSPEARFTFVYPNTVLAPYANIDSGKVELNTQVLLKNLTDGAVIYYNMVHGKGIKEESVAEPTLSSTVFNEEYPFTITEKTIIKAMAAKDGVKSKVVTFIYDPMVQLAAPTASIETGSVVSNGTVLELKAANGATVYYTLDGSDPADVNNTAVMNGNSIILHGEPGGQATIKAYAKGAGNSQSEVATFTYQFSQNAMGGVTASIESGTTVSNGTKVILMTDVTDAEIYYTTNGESPVDHGTEGTTVEIDGNPGSSFTIKAVAKINGETGIISTFIYKIQDIPDAPTASPAGGTLTVATRVTLDSEADEIYYTIDGTEPTKSSNLYTEPILINRTTTLKAIAVSKDGGISEVASFQYMAAPKAGMPKSNHESGEILDPGTKVELWTDTQNAVIYYTTDGTEPTVDNLDTLLVYDSDGIEIHRSVTIKAVAYYEGMRLSGVSDWNYIVEAIPAVEIKNEEAAKLAEVGLQDTNADALKNKNDQEEYGVLYGKERDINQLAVRNVKQLFGDDYTILSEYKVNMKYDKKYEVVLPIPKGYEDAKLSVVAVDSNSKLTTVKTRRENGVLYASDILAKDFAIVGVESPEENNKSIPYLQILEIVTGAVLIFGLGYYAKEKYKNYKKRQ